MPSKIEAALKNSDKTTPNVPNILVFHKLTNELTFGSTNYSPQRLTGLVQNLTDSGFEFVSMSNLLAASNSKQLALTFDDGYAHLMQSLPPLLKKFDIKPTVFVPTALIGKRNTWDYSSLFKSERHLNYSEIKELTKSGVEFGSHGHTHTNLTQCSNKVLKEELSVSKAILEDLLNCSVDSISYPFGRYNSKVQEAAKEVGYENGLTMKFPSLDDNLFTCGRIPIYFYDNQAFVRQKLENGILRKIHQGLGRIINNLSYGTILLNLITERKSV